MGVCNLKEKLEPEEMAREGKEGQEQPTNNASCVCYVFTCQPC